MRDTAPKRLAAAGARAAPRHLRRAARGGCAAAPGPATALLALALAPAALEGQEIERHELAGDRIAIWNLAGAVQVVGGTGSSVVVEVARGGEDAGRLTIRTGPLEGVETLRVLYPGDRVVYRDAGRGSRSQIRVRDDGTFGREGRRVTVAGSGGGVRAHADLTVRVPSGKEVAVYLGIGSADASGLEANLLLDTHSASVTAREIRGFLSVDTGSGRVEASGIEGDLVVDTGSGGIDVSGVRGGRINLDTGSGRVTGADLRADELRVDTGSGRIALTGVAATDLRLDTGSGGVELELVSDVRSLEVDTGSGGVVLRVPETLGARLEIETGSGSIDSEMPIEMTRSGRGRLSGRIGDGDGLVRIETGSGSVRILGR